MKVNWLFPSAVIVLASCEKPAPIIADEPKRKMPMPTRIQESPPDPGSSSLSEIKSEPKAAETPPAVKNSPPPPPAPKPASASRTPEASPVPNQPGFVFSPHNGKIVDVRNIPSGTLVADPMYPPTEKKHFRVP
jgi:hypothetical protein